MSLGMRCGVTQVRCVVASVPQPVQVRGVIVTMLCVHLLWWDNAGVRDLVYYRPASIDGPSLTWIDGLDIYSTINTPKNVTSGQSCHYIDNLKPGFSYFGFLPKLVWNGMIRWFGIFIRIFVLNVRRKRSVSFHHSVSSSLGPNSHRVS